jgi:proteasome lid subunit RPN8/RPN11
VILHLPEALSAALWTHADRESPRECVGVIGGREQGPVIQGVALYPLLNIAARPESEYVADPGRLLRALRAMDADTLALVALYHSHPAGPAWPSAADIRLARYPVPHVIADLRSRTLRAFWLPEAEPVPIVTGPAEARASADTPED